MLFRVDDATFGGYIVDRQNHRESPGPTWQTASTEVDGKETRKNVSDDMLRLKVQRCCLVRVCVRVRVQVGACIVCACVRVRVYDEGRLIIAVIIAIMSSRVQL